MVPVRPSARPVRRRSEPIARADRRLLGNTRERDPPFQVVARRGLAGAWCSACTRRFARGDESTVQPRLIHLPGESDHVDMGRAVPVGLVPPHPGQHALRKPLVAGHAQARPGLLPKTGGGQRRLAPRAIRRRAGSVSDPLQRLVRTPRSSPRRAADVTESAPTAAAGARGPTFVRAIASIRGEQRRIRRRRTLSPTHRHPTSFASCLSSVP